MPGPGYALSARRENDLEMVITIPTTCWNNANGKHPRMVSCSFSGYHSTHYLYLLLDDGGLRFVEAILDPPDFPHVDLVSSALESQDLLGLVESITRRGASYAKRWEEYSTLPARYEPMWQPMSSSLTILTDVANLTVTVDVPHDWPWPTSGELKPASIRVLAADGIPYHRREGIAALSAELAADAARAGGDNQGGLAKILLELESKLFTYAYRCRNDCEGNGVCDTSVFPPVCRCFEGFGNDDCSHVACPNDCSGRGACDEKQICEHDAETGETDCVGGTGKCSCEEPYFGADCSLQPCAKRYLVKEGVDVTLGEAHFKSLYEAMGWKVSEVRLSPTNATRPRGGPSQAIPSPSRRAAFGVAYVVFSASEDAMVARSLDPFYRDSIPSRGVAGRARDFPEELRALEQRGDISSVFSARRRWSARATARVITAPGSVTARRGTSARRASTPTAPRIAPGTVAAILSRGGASARITIRQISSRGANFARSASPPPRARTPPWTSAWTPRDDAWFLCNSAACSASTSARRRLRRALPRGERHHGGEGRLPHALPRVTLPNPRRRRRRISPARSSRPPIPFCSDCSGYDEYNVSQIHLYPEEPCRSVLGRRSAECVEGRVASDVVRGLGMLPPATPRNPRRSPSTSPPCDAKICDSRDSTRDRASSAGVVSLRWRRGCRRVHG